MPELAAAQGSLPVKEALRCGTLALLLALSVSALPLRANAQAVVTAAPASSSAVEHARVRRGLLVGTLSAAVLSLGVGALVYLADKPEAAALSAPGIASLALAPLGASLGVLLAAPGEGRVVRVVTAALGMSLLATATSVGLAAGVVTAAGGDPVAIAVYGFGLSLVANSIAAPLAARGALARLQREQASGRRRSVRLAPSVARAGTDLRVGGMLEVRF
jgi:hypothetical protein